MTRSLILLMALSGLVFAQNQPTSGGWRRVGDRPPEPPPGPMAQGPQTGDPEPVERTDSDAFGQPAQGPEQQPPQQSRQAPPLTANRPMYGPPPELTLHPGTYLTVRTSQALSSDHNQPGDTFVASLAQPVVVDGIVIANRNQLVYGRVAEAERAHSDRPSRLALELTSLTLADGTQVPIRSQLVARRGGTTPVDQQVGTVATTTAVGAVVGAAADWGRGAAMANVRALSGYTTVA